MSNRVFVKSALVIFIVFIGSANSFHLAELRNLPDTQEASNVTSSFKSGNSNTNTGTSVKGNIGSISSLLSNPTQIINQIQSTVNSLLQTLNSTLSGGSSSNATSLISIIKNITVKSPNSLRLDETDQIVGNISEILRTAANSEADTVNNATTRFNDEVKGAFEDLRKSFLELKSSVQEHPSQQRDEHEQDEVAPSITERKVPSSDIDVLEARNTENTSRQGNGRSMKPNGLPRTLFDQLSSLRTKVDSRIQRSLINARSSLEDSLGLARQNYNPNRNQTVGMAGFMGEIQRVFNEVSAPFRNFFEAMRRGRPTAVVTA